MASPVPQANYAPLRRRALLWPCCRWQARHSCLLL